MRCRFTYLTIFLICALAGTAQLKVQRPLLKKQKESSFGLSGSVTNSALLLQRNVNDDNAATGLGGGVIYEATRLLRYSAEFTLYRNLSIEPTWLKVRARTFEVNAHFIARLKDAPAYFYPIGGISYNVFEGFFTGRNDYQHLKQYYESNSQVKTRWLGLNTGVGFDYFVKRFSLFGEFKLRTGFSDREFQLNIMDVCYSAGLRYTISEPSIYKLFRGTRSRYALPQPGGK